MTDKFHAEARGIIERYVRVSYETEEWLFLCTGNVLIPVGSGIAYQPLLGIVQRVVTAASAATVNTINDQLAALKLREDLH